MIGVTRGLWWMLALAVLLGVSRAQAGDPSKDCSGPIDARRVAACTPLIAGNSLETVGNQAVARYNRGAAHEAQGDHDRAIADYSTALEFDPKYALAYTGRGLAYEAKGDHDRAIADYTAALALDPKIAVAYDGRGIAYEAKGDHDRAIADYDAAIELDPQVAGAYTNRGLAYEAKGDHDRAIADYDAALKLDPKLAVAYDGRGEAYEAKGDHDRAIADYDASLKLDPNVAVAYDGRGAAYEAKGDHDRAIADYDAALRLDPKLAGAYTNRGLAYEAKGDHDHAIADYDAAIRFDPKLAVAYDGRGIAREAKGDHARAIADYDAAIELDPKVAGAYTNRGLAYEAKGDHDRAIADYDAALKLDPKLAVAYDGRGLAHDAKGDHDRAIADYDTALELDPKDSVAYYNRAAAFENKARDEPGEKGMADLAGALAVYRSYLQLFPGDGDATAAVARVTQAIASRQKASTAAAPSSQPAAAPLPTVIRAEPAATDEKRIALVIGNARYAAIGMLPNPRNDAREVAATLEAEGFVVTALNDLTHEQLVRALAAFAEAAATADWALVYFSGHGLEMGGINYLIPVDAQLATDTAVQFEAVPLGQAMAAVDGARKLRLVILDACRSNPFATRMHLSSASRAVSRGLARPPEPDPGELVVYAAREGEVASDGTGDHSPFTAALVKEIRSSHVDVRRLFDFVRDDVIEATGGHQHPFTYGSLPGRQDFLFSAK